MPRFWKGNPKGAGTFVGRKDGTKRLIGPEEFEVDGRIAFPRDESWGDFKSAFEAKAKEQHRDKTTRLTSGTTRTAHWSGRRGLAHASPRLCRRILR